MEVTLFGRDVPEWASELVLHNWAVILFVLGAFVASIRAYQRPSRASILLLYGFLILTVAFEYEKHGLRPVQGIIDDVFSRNLVGRDIARMAILRVLPPLLYLFGFSFIAVSVAMARRKSRNTASEQNGSAQSIRKPA